MSSSASTYVALLGIDYNSAEGSLKIDNIKKMINNNLKRKRDKNSDTVIGFKYLLEKLINDPLTSPIVKDLGNSILTSEDLGNLLMRFLYSDRIIICPAYLVNTLSTLLKAEIPERKVFIMCEFPNLPITDNDMSRVLLAFSSITVIQSKLISARVANQFYVQFTIGFTKSLHHNGKSIIFMKSIEVLEEPGMTFTGFLVVTCWTNKDGVLPRKQFQFNIPGSVKYCIVHKKIEFDYSVISASSSQCLGDKGFDSAISSIHFQKEMSNALQSIESLHVLCL